MHMRAQPDALMRGAVHVTYPLSSGRRALSERWGSNAVRQTQNSHKSETIARAASANKNNATHTPHTNAILLRMVALIFYTCCICITVAEMQVLATVCVTAPDC